MDVFGLCKRWNCMMECVNITLCGCVWAMNVLVKCEHHMILCGCVWVVSVL